MNVAVIGGGINGVMSAWALALKGCSVELFERGQLMGETSSASTKLLHGGLRYLEHGQFRLVNEALHERRWWMDVAPHLAKPLQIWLPVYRDSMRPKWMMSCGLALYDWLAGKASIGAWHWFPTEEVPRFCPELRAQGLMGAYSFYDGQMDDRALGLWAADRAVAAGVRVHTEARVDAITSDAHVVVNGAPQSYDRVVNVAGPWARQLLDVSGIPAQHDLDLIRGSHLLINQPSSHAYILQAPQDGRICFVLPHMGKTLVGSTEVRQSLNAPICCSPQEKKYLLELYRHYLPGSNATVCGEFAGLRPLIGSHADPNKVTREYAVERKRNIISVFGGKWTTSRVLGLRVAEAVMTAR